MYVTEGRETHAQCMRSQLRVHSDTRRVRQQPADPAAHCHHDDFHTWFSVPRAPTNLRNGRKMQPLTV